MIWKENSVLTLYGEICRRSRENREREKMTHTYFTTGLTIKRHQISRRFSEIESKCFLISDFRFPSVLDWFLSKKHEQKKDFSRSFFQLSHFLSFIDLWTQVCQVVRSMVPSVSNALCTWPKAPSHVRVMCSHPKRLPSQRTNSVERFISPTQYLEGQELLIVWSRSNE